MDGLQDMIAVDDNKEVSARESVEASEDSVTCEDRNLGPEQDNSDVGSSEFLEGAVCHKLVDELARYA